MPPVRRTGDPLIEFVEGLVERRIGVDGDRVRDRPVQPGHWRSEFFVCSVADGDDEARHGLDLIEMTRGSVGEGEVRSARSLHCSWMDPLGGVRASGQRWLAGSLRPKCGDDLGSG
jgi:hypothetical protein